MHQGHVYSWENFSENQYDRALGAINRAEFLDKVVLYHAPGTTFRIRIDFREGFTETVFQRTPDTAAGNVETELRKLTHSTLVTAKKVTLMPAVNPAAQWAYHMPAFCQLNLPPPSETTKKALLCCLRGIRSYCSPSNPLPLVVRDNHWNLNVCPTLYELVHVIMLMPANGVAISNLFVSQTGAENHDGEIHFALPNGVLFVLTATCLRVGPGFDFHLRIGFAPVSIDFPVPAAAGGDFTLFAARKCFPLPPEPILSDRAKLVVAEHEEIHHLKVSRAPWFSWSMLWWLVPCVAAARPTETLVLEE